MDAQLLPKILIVIPAYNEQGKIGRVVKKIPPELGAHILVIDDHSRDETSDEARSGGAMVLRHTQNTGVGGAIRSGIDYARQNHYDYLAVVSGDDQHDPNDLPGLFQPLLQQGSDFVQGSRRLGGLNAPNIGWFRRIFTWVYAFIFRLLTGFPCSDATNGGRAFRVDIFERYPSINLWQDWLNTYELEPYLFYKVVKLKLKVTEAPMKVIYHSLGTSKMKPFRDWWRILRPMILLSLGLRK